MATETLTLPPSNQIVPGSKLIPIANFPSSKETSPPSSPDDIASSWVTSFNDFLDGDDKAIDRLFLAEACWRDLLCMTWDYHTLQGHDKIASFISNASKDSRITSISLDKSASYKAPQESSLGDLKIIQAFLTVETTIGRGKGVVRLAVDSSDGDKWKAFTLFTTLHEIKGHEEKTRTRRPTGINRDAEAGGRNWQDQLKVEQNFEGDKEPVVLIVGAGQGGLTVAARLKQLGVEAVIIDRNPRLGDNWRNRYHQLVLHDSVWYDHMPYLNFPPNWPIFTPKDKLADWFEYYAGILELNVWTSTTIKSSSWSQAERKWTIDLVRDINGKTESRSLHPSHVILATGHSGEPYFPSDIAGLSTFKGSRLLHSSQFTQPSSHGEGKHAVVVGSCNSGHDIARDYHDHGWDVTMIQRSSTLVVTSETLLTTQKGLYDEDGPPVEEADLLTHSIPSPISKTLSISLTTHLTALDAPLLSSLLAAGFALDSGPDSAGLMQKYLHRGGGYYIDVGCSRLIAEGKVKVRSGVSVKEVKEKSIVLSSGEQLNADEIVMATGYQNMRTTARGIFGDALDGEGDKEGGRAKEGGAEEGEKAEGEGKKREAVGDVWGFDSEGEIRNMWRPTSHPGFWFMGGNLALCRFYSRLLALQILGVELGLKK